MANKQVIVIGGGLSGILATLSLSRQKNVKTTLVERSSSLGGLFSSAWNYENYHFDFGSRFIVGAGHHEIDNILFNLLVDNGYWVTTKSLAEHSYQNGTVCDYSNCLDARLLDDSSYIKCVQELISKKDVKISESVDLSSYCEQAYGLTITQKLLIPTIEKLSKVDATDLLPSVLNKTGLSRVILFDRDLTRRLKLASPAFDRKIAYTHHSEHQSDLVKAYPIKSNLNTFGKILLNYLNMCNNVEVLLDEGISKIHSQGHKCKAVETESGRSIKVDQIVSCLPLPQTARMLDLKFEGAKPNVQKIQLLHMVFDGKVNSGSYFFYDYDPTSVIRRVTFYDNFVDQNLPYKRITLELNEPNSKNQQQYLGDFCLRRLMDYGLLSTNKIIASSEPQIVINPYSLLTTLNQQNKTQLEQRMKAACENLCTFSADPTYDWAAIQFA